MSFFGVLRTYTGSLLMTCILTRNINIPQIQVFQHIHIHEISEITLLQEMILFISLCFNIFTFLNRTFRKKNTKKQLIMGNNWNTKKTKAVFLEWTCLQPRSVFPAIIANVSPNISEFWDA